MPGAVGKLRFALDHNFPANVVATFGTLMPRLELVPVRDIDPRFAELDDWELFVALHRHAERWDGLITNDEALLALPKEMTVLSQTHLTLVIASGEGDSPIRAVGVLLCHLNHICHHSKPNRAQTWRLRVAQKNHEEPRTFLEKIAERDGVTVESVIHKHKLPAKELKRP